MSQLIILFIYTFRLCRIMTSTRALKNTVKKNLFGQFWSITLPKSYQQNQNRVSKLGLTLGLSNLAGNHITYYQAGKIRTNLCVQLYSDYYGIEKKILFFLSGILKSRTVMCDSLTLQGDSKFYFKAGQAHDVVWLF